MRLGKQDVASGPCVCKFIGRLVQACGDILATNSNIMRTYYSRLRESRSSVVLPACWSSSLIRKVVSDESES